MLVALDRQERGQGELSAIQEVQKELEIPVHALITMKDLMDYLEAKAKRSVSKCKLIVKNTGFDFNNIKGRSA